MPAIYEHFHTVLDAEIDRLGHANNLAYLAWMQAAALAHSAAQGLPPEIYHQRRAGWVVRSHEIKYLRSAVAGDRLVVRTWVADLKKVSSRRRYKIYRTSDEALLASAATEWAFIDYDTGRLLKVPDEIAAAFEVVGE